MWQFVATAAALTAAAAAPITASAAIHTVSVPTLAADAAPITASSAIHTVTVATLAADAAAAVAAAAAAHVTSYLLLAPFLLSLLLTPFLLSLLLTPLLPWLLLTLKPRASRHSNHLCTGLPYGGKWHAPEMQVRVPIRLVTTELTVTSGGGTSAIVVCKLYPNGCISLSVMLTYHYCCFCSVLDQQEVLHWSLRFG